MPPPEPLYEAARNGEMQLVVQLVNKRANLETRGFDDDTPLLASVEYHHAELVRALLLQLLISLPEADVNARDSAGMCPMHFAVLYGNEDVKRTLICNGAERAPLCNKGQSPDDYQRDVGFLGAGRLT